MTDIGAGSIWVSAGNRRPAFREPEAGEEESRVRSRVVGKHPTNLDNFCTMRLRHASIVELRMCFRFAHLIRPKKRPPSAALDGQICERMLWLFGLPYDRRLFPVSSSFGLGQDGE
jgi:hypothetical protein